MLKNYLKIAFRNLVRYKAYSVINISGLAIGITCFMLIYLFIKDELSYDKFHSKADRIYRVTERIDADGQGENSSSNPFPVMKAMLNDYPHLIEEGVRLFNFQQPTLTLEYKDQKFNESKIFFADSTFFKVFDFPLAVGDKNTVLAKPNSVVLTKKLANKYFGDENPVGQSILYEGNFNLAVTGVFEDLPLQSHMDFDCLISFSTIYQITGGNFFDQQWIWNPCWTYILLKDGVNPGELEKQFPEFVQKYYPDFIKPQVSHSLQALTDIHLHSKLDYEMYQNNDAANIYIFSAVGIMILFIACINFMNLATARSARRAREVGMRKVLGAEKKQLVKQFLGESTILSFIAVIIAALFVELLIPLFNNLAGKELTFDLFSDPATLVVLLVVGLVVGIVSGLYPAFFLSASEPIKVVKSSFKLETKSVLLRKGLVVLQFAISLALIIGTLVVYEQLNYMQNANLGFNKEQIVVIPFRPPIVNRYEAFKNDLLRNNNITHVSVMNEIIGQHHNTHEINYEGMETDKVVYFPGLLVDEDFSETFDLQIIAGRDFSKEYPRDDSLGIIINEATVKNLGWGSPEEAINKKFSTSFGGGISNSERVIGVVKDFNFVSLKKPIEAFFLDIAPAQTRPFFLKYAAARIKPGDVKNTIAYIGEQWNRSMPEYPFEFSFLDENLNQMYKEQDNLGKLVAYFSILAILIACLGMFALASFSAEQRTKEIGIRKVLGASVSGIILLFSKDFMKLILLAVIIASPAAYFVLDKWLDDFAFRINISFSVFIIAAAITLLIALSTISYQAIRAALANPVKAVKYE
ncbi:MAG: ABC transporter permease [Ignavibacteriaceae bacterium]